MLKLMVKKIFTIFTLNICLSETMEEKNISQKSMEANWVQTEIIMSRPLDVDYMGESSQFQ